MSPIQAYNTSSDHLTQIVQAVDRALQEMDTSLLLTISEAAELR
jgi:hypothetical protein